MWTKEFWRAIAERAIKTFCQSLAAMLVAAPAGEALGILTVDWVGILSVVGLTTLASVLSNIATGAVTDGNPSAGSAEVLPRRAID